MTRKHLCCIIMLGLMWTPFISNQKVYDKLLSSGISLLKCFRTGICLFSHLGNIDQILLEFYLFVYHFNYFKHTNQQHEVHSQYCATIISVSRTFSLSFNRDFVPLKQQLLTLPLTWPLVSTIVSISMNLPILSTSDKCPFVSGLFHLA